MSSIPVLSKAPPASVTFSFGSRPLRRVRGEAGTIAIGMEIARDAVERAADRGRNRIQPSAKMDGRSDADIPAIALPRFLGDAGIRA